MAAATALLVASCGDGRSVEPPLPESPVHEATFGDQGGEANREGPDSPAAEQVEDRAYPRTYVDDRLALQGKRSFKRLPGALPRSAFRSTASFKDGLAAAPRSWRVLGPVTPEVAPEASQFFDPSTGNVATTTQSGRVTAMAIDPNCGRPGRGCRLWVAAAGGGIWRTNDALSRQPRWIAPPGALPTNAFGSLIVDPNDPGGNTLYAGSGEPNGSGDSEAGLGLFRSTDGGRSWHLVRGSRKVAINRSIGSIAVEPGDPRTIYIGTDVARHGSSSVNGGRRTPPNAPGLGVYKSTDGGRHFALEKNLKGQTPPNPADPATGLDWFQGGVNKLQIDPGDPHTVYAAVFGYGLWRSKDGGHTWSQVFHTLYQNDFSDPVDTGDTVGDRTEFDLVEIRGHTRIYVGDSSDDLFVAEFWRVERAETKTASQLIGKDDNAGWTKISDRHNGTNGFLSYNYCQNGQCGYDDFVVSPPGRPDTVWLGGSMAYDELPLYGGIPPSQPGHRLRRLRRRRHPRPRDAPAGSLERVRFPNGRLRPGCRAGAACAGRSRRLPDASARDPQSPRVAERRPQRHPVPVAVLQPEEAGPRPAGRDPGQRHLLVLRVAEVARDRRWRRRPVGLRPGGSDDPLPQLLRRHARGP